MYSEPKYEKYGGENICACTQLLLTITSQALDFITNHGLLLQVYLKMAFSFVERHNVLALRD